jgi:hypothetical protein
VDIAASCLAWSAAACARYGALAAALRLRHALPATFMTFLDSNFPSAFFASLSLAKRS